MTGKKIRDESLLVNMNLNRGGGDEPIKLHTQEPVKLILIRNSVMCVEKGPEFSFNLIRLTEETEIINI